MGTKIHFEVGAKALSICCKKNTPNFFQMLDANLRQLLVEKNLFVKYTYFEVGVKISPKSGSEDDGRLRSL